MKERSLAKLMSIDAIVESAWQVYQREERITQRVFWNDETGEFVGDTNFIFNKASHEENLMALPQETINSILGHLEEMLDKKFARVISYTDAGHLHLKIPTSVKAEIEASTSDKVERMQLVMKHPDTLFLYHTAEKVELLDEHDDPISPEHGWWYLNRNVIGSQNGITPAYTVVKEGDGYNTYGNPEGYSEYSPSIYFQGHKNGCFQISHNDEPINLDITFQMLPSDPEVMRLSEGK
mgnify:CR=1 FL=1